MAVFSLKRKVDIIETEEVFKFFRETAGCNISRVDNGTQGAQLLHQKKNQLA